jgi:uncharacterized membrane protein YdfJ with MMPL/SSD domain
VLVDAVIVRTLLTPALVVLFGRANWYLPRWAAALLRVKPTPVPTTDSDGAIAEPREPVSYLL